jgi:O-antigen/teichoic acid export membrane protein
MAVDYPASYKSATRGMKLVDTVTKRRLGRTLIAQLYGQAVIIVCQLALVPVLLWGWGTERYGSWLILTAVPTFLTFSDFGFTFVAKNEMVMAVAAHNRPLAQTVFQSILAMLCFIVPAMIAISAITLVEIDPSRSLSTAIISAFDARIVLFAFICNVLLYQFFLLICAGIRAENKPATETVLAATARLFESTAIGVAAVSGGGLTVAALAALFTRIIFLCVAYGWLRRVTPWLSLGFSMASRREIRRLAHPALAYMLVPMGQALLIQGPIIVLGALSGPLAVVIFSTTRTLTRLGTAATNMFNNTFVAEYSTLAGKTAFDSFHHLRTIQMRISLVLIVIYVITLTLVSRPIMNIFTHGKVAVLQPLFFVMTLAVAAEMFWSAQFTPLVAVNRHKAVTYSLAALSVIGFGLCYASVSMFGIIGASITLLLVHITIVGVCALTTAQTSLKRKAHNAA